MCTTYRGGEVKTYRHVINHVATIHKGVLTLYLQHTVQVRLYTYLLNFYTFTIVFRGLLRDSSGSLSV